MRERAAFAHARSLTVRQQWQRLADFAVDWHHRAQRSPVALWIAVDALLRVGEPLRADMLMVSDGRPSATTAERQLSARVAFEARGLADALEHIASLSDDVDRSDELLESMLITHSAGRHDESIGADLERRIRLTYGDFGERFPHSTIVSEHSAPAGEASFEETLGRHVAARKAFVEDVERDVAAGRASLAMLALVHGSVTRAWLASSLLPLATPRPEDLAQEVAIAERAVGGGASWDVSALVVLSGLRRRTTDAAINALPASVLPRAVADEVTAEQVRVGDLGGSSASVTHDPASGRAVILEHAPETVRALTDRLARVAAVARRCRVVDPDAAGEDEVAVALRDADLDRSAQTWLGAARAAQQHTMPLYCDDRYVRSWAHSLGLETFGTLALLFALLDREMIDNEAVAEAKWTLREQGARHVALATGEIVARVVADDLDLRPAVLSTLHDPDL